MIEILMIEDDPDFARHLGVYLKQYDIKITNYEDPYLGLSCGVDKYDLLILDLTLEGMDGLEVCQKITTQYDIPIIISSARGDISDRVIGLEYGADDYLPKPYDPKEMLARIMSLLRRYKKIAKTEDTTQAIQSDFEILNNEINYKGSVLELTKAEFEILHVLRNSFNHTLSREQIVNSCESLNDSYGKTLNTIIGRIRHKSSLTCIAAVRGIGYKLVE